MTDNASNPSSSRSREITVALVQIECHPALRIGSNDYLAEPFIDERGLCLAALASNGLAVDHLKLRCKDEYLGWHAARLDSIVDWLCNLRQSDFPDVIVLPKWSVPRQLLRCIAKVQARTKSQHDIHGPLILAGSHSFEQAPNAVDEYRNLGIPQATLSMLAAQEVDAVMSVFNPDGQLELIPIDSLAPHEPTMTATFESESLAKQCGKKLEIRLFGAESISVQTFSSINALSHADQAVFSDADLSVIVSYERHPEKVNTVVEMISQRHCPVVHCNDGAFGGSCIAAPFDRRSEEWITRFMSHGLPAGDGILVTRVPLSSDSETGIRRDLPRLLKLSPVVPDNSEESSWRVSNAIEDMRQHIEKSGIFALAIDHGRFISRLMEVEKNELPTPIQQLQLSRLIALTHLSLVSRRELEVLGSDCRISREPMELATHRALEIDHSLTAEFNSAEIQRQIPSLQSLESRMATFCHDEVSDYLTRDELLHIRPVISVYQRLKEKAMRDSPDLSDTSERVHQSQVSGTDLFFQLGTIAKTLEDAFSKPDPDLIESVVSELVDIIRVLLGAEVAFCWKLGSEAELFVIQSTAHASLESRLPRSVPKRIHMADWPDTRRVSVGPVAHLAKNATQRLNKQGSQFYTDDDISFLRAIGSQACLPLGDEKFGPRTGIVALHSHNDHFTGDRIALLERSLPVLSALNRLAEVTVDRTEKATLLKRLQELTPTIATAPDRLAFQRALCTALTQQGGLLFDRAMSFWNDDGKLPATCEMAIGGVMNFMRESEDLSHHASANLGATASLLSDIEAAIAHPIPGEGETEIQDALYEVACNSEAPLTFSANDHGKMSDVMRSRPTKFAVPKMSPDDPWIIRKREEYPGLFDSPHEEYFLFPLRPFANQPERVLGFIIADLSFHPHSHIPGPGFPDLEMTEFCLNLLTRYWLEHTRARSRDSAYGGKLIAEQVFEGWVKGDKGDHVIVEFAAARRTVDQHFSLQDCEGDGLPEFGRAVRLISQLLTATDLETAPAEDGEGYDINAKQNLWRRGGGEYTIGE